ncbi:hypothetical protein KBA41_10430 [Candidatus Ozemobacteraceae bacterium]|nr:hypothetical protein [Candidatus Ozemobacteraceae bacterium]
MNFPSRRFLICSALWLALAGTAPAAETVPMTSDSPDLTYYSRTPLSVKLSRLFSAGQDLFNRRRYEEAQAVFESMRALDDKDLLSVFWVKKCRERLEREANEQRKSDNRRLTGRLFPREEIYTNWRWGPEVGHFEVRESKPKPYVEPVRKIRPRAGDKELAKAKSAAADNKPEALFDLAMAHWSRKENGPAIDALEKAAELNPDILARDDEGLTAAVQDELRAALEKGKPTPAQLLRAGRVAIIQGDLLEAFRDLIRAATEDASLLGEVKPLLQKLVDTGKTEFLFRAPELWTFRQGYAFENGEDRLYIKLGMAPRAAVPMAPLDLMFEREAIGTIEELPSDVLCTLIDPSTTETTRLWIVGKFRESDGPIEVNGKLLVRFQKDRLMFLDMSNFNAAPELPDNWSVVVGAADAFSVSFPIGQLEKIENGVNIKAFQLRMNTGKGPVLSLSELRKPLPAAVDVWKTLDNAAQGAL